MDVPRRAVVTALPVVAVLPAVAVAGCTSAGKPGTGYFTAHEAAVITAATARIAPGPADDPAEAGHPGAREADVTGYIDRLLGPAPVIFAGGPWSSRHAAGHDRMAVPVEPDPVAKIAWRQRLSDWRRQYRAGVATLDRLAGGDFAAAATGKQDEALAKAGPFLDLLYQHTIEGLYSNPEYGGNRALAGWHDIAYPGDSQPAGYPAARVTGSDGHDPVALTPVVSDALRFLGFVSTA